MADIPINPVTRRVEFTGNTGTGPFAFTFNVLAQADVAAYKNNTLLALTSDYTVSLNSNGTGSITLASALIATDELVIIGDLALSRTTDFVTAGDLLASSLNEQFDSNVVMSQQLDERFDRTIRSQPGDINKNLYLPLVSSRASQLLSFDSSGNITTTSLSNVPDIGTVNLTVSGVASFADGSASAPSITNIGDTNTGMYFGAADQINFSIGGSEVISVASTGTTISGLSISSGDILLTDNSATALEIKEGSNNYLTFITTNGSEKLSFGSTANPTFEVNGSFRQPLIAATTSFFSQTYSGATLSATNGSVNIESYSASKAGIVLNGSGDQITFTSPTLGFVGLVQVVGAITTNTSLNIASSTTVTGILDEDNMASNSATKLATQQSIKAYVDAQVGTVDTLAEVLANGNTTGSNNIIVTAGQSITVDTISETTAANGVVIDGVTLKDGGATVTADVTFGDNDKAIFGAGSDLQIYHDGLHSYIEEAGTGRLHFKSNSYIFYNAAGTERAIDFLENDEVRLYFDGDEKLATTSTGVDITGTITSDGLTVDGLAKIQGAATGLVINETDTTDLNTYFNANSGDFNLMTTNDAFTSFTTRLNVDHSTGDISFYEDTGGTAKLSWSASNERLFLSGSDYQFGIGQGANQPWYSRAVSDGSYRLHLNGTGDIVTLTSSGNVGIGCSPDNKVNIQESALSGRSASNGNTSLTLEHATDTGIQFFSATQTQLRFGDAASTGAGSIIYTHSDNALKLSTNGSEAMRIDSSGNVGIGTSSPTTSYGKALHIHNPTTTGSNLRLTNSTSGSGAGNGFEIVQLGVDDYLINREAGAMVFYTNNAEAMRIDSSGNLLVSKTSVDSGVVGVEAKANGTLVATVDGDTVSLLNRKTSDGEIFRLQKDGSTIGSIGSNTTSGQSLLDLTATQNFRVLTNGSERMRIDSSGAVVINNSGGDAQIYLGGTSGTTRMYLARSGADSFLWNVSNGNIRFGTNNAEAMRIDSSGNLLVGTALTSEIDESGTRIVAGDAGFIEHSRTSTTDTLPNLVLARGNDGEAIRFLRNDGSNREVGDIVLTTNSTSYNTSSDHRLKENVVDLIGATARLNQLAPKRFNFIADADTTVDGFLAHEVQTVVPEAIHGTHNEVDADGNPVYQGIDQSKLVPLLVATIQELEARITALENA